jgi:hypothetical protein
MSLPTQILLDYEVGPLLAPGDLGFSRGREFIRLLRPSAMKAQNESAHYKRSESSGNR